jgi:hypothetical protein
MDEHDCTYYRTGELRPESDADYVVTRCDSCGSEMLFEASPEDYRIAEYVVTEHGLAVLAYS